MMLHAVEIKNFRSIANLTVPMNPTCRILVGINESGKSNIIRALATLSDDVVLNPADKRQVLPEEPLVTEAYIRFVFNFDESDINVFHEELCNVIVGNRDLPMFINQDDAELTLVQFLRLEKIQKLFKADLITQKKNISSWKIKDNYEIESGWKTISSQCPPAYEIVLPDGSKIQLNSYKLVHETMATDIPAEYLKDITFSDINAWIDNVIAEYWKDYCPDTIYWTYDEKNLLPAQIDLTQFTSNPQICLPLKEMFELAGISDIKKHIDDAKISSAFGIKNCLDRVAQLTTQHFREVWKEYDKVSFNLSLNGNFIEAAVKDEFNHYEFTKRSDGFKRFVTFLLLISTRARTDQLSNALILIDEPDICLHPSGARYLRDELIKISQNNYVIYSTHSIFMIDKENIERHLIVSKQGEKTSIKAADDSNIVDEEVLYNALGYSIFESLKKKNIIFEGWRDKKLCEEALKKPPKEFQDLKNLFLDIGFCHARGVKDIQNITPLLQLASRECLILSDDDKAAKDKQKEFKKTKGYGIWLRYSEVDDSVEAVTGEDFIKSEVIVECIRSLKETREFAKDFTSKTLLSTKGKMDSIQKWLKGQNIADEEQKLIIEAVKNHLFAHLKSSQIEDSYYSYLSKVAGKISE